MHLFHDISRRHRMSYNIREKKTTHFDGSLNMASIFADENLNE